MHGYGNPKRDIGALPVHLFLWTSSCSPYIHNPSLLPTLLSLSLLGPEVTIHKMTSKSKGKRTHEQGQWCGDCGDGEWVEVEEGTEGINGNGK